jgi:hypothetical protein
MLVNPSLPVNTVPEFVAFAAGGCLDAVNDSRYCGCARAAAPRCAKSIFAKCWRILN